jgi:hypothetical protein
MPCHNDVSGIGENSHCGTFKALLALYLELDARLQGSVGGEGGLDRDAYQRRQ